MPQGAESKEVLKLHSGTKGDGESWVHWALFRRTEGGLIGYKDELFNPDDKEDMNSLLCSMGFVYSDGGPGRAFHRAGYYKKNRFHVLVTQDGGLDI